MHRIDHEARIHHDIRRYPPNRGDARDGSTSERSLVLDERSDRGAYQSSDK